MNKCYIFLIYFSLVLCNFWQSRASAAIPCSYSNDIRINVFYTEFSDHIHYAYQLQKPEKVIVNSLILGEAVDQPAMQIIPENTPIKICSAAGYRGLAVYEEEGFYQTLVWERDNKADPICDGFGVDLPRNRNPEKGIYSDGKAVSAANFAQLHFRIITEAGKSHCGFTTAATSIIPNT